jgi:hypothetical protein
MVWAEMTPLERDKLVAKFVMGWEFAKPRHGSCCTCQRCGRDYESCSWPNSCEYTYTETDASVADRIEGKIEQADRVHAYCSHLVAIVNQEHPSNPTWALIRATNAQRCLAALRALEVDV